MDVDVDVNMDVDKHTDVTKNEPFRVTIRNAWRGADPAPTMVTPALNTHKRTQVDKAA